MVVGATAAMVAMNNANAGGWNIPDTLLGNVLAGVIFVLLFIALYVAVCCFLYAVFGGRE